MSNEEAGTKGEEALGLGGSVTMDLKDYNLMRDTIESMLKTLFTEQEFLVRFRKSLIPLIEKAKEKGIDLELLFDHYKNPDFKELEEIVVIRDDSDKETTRIIIKAKLKVDE